MAGLVIILSTSVDLNTSINTKYNFPSVSKSPSILAITTPSHIRSKGPGLDISSYMIFEEPPNIINNLTVSDATNDTAYNKYNRNIECDNRVIKKKNGANLLRNNINSLIIISNISKKNRY